jgi:hypothetical protein
MVSSYHVINGILPYKLPLSTSVGRNVALKYLRLLVLQANLNCALDLLAFTLAQFCSLGWQTTAAANSAAQGIAASGSSVTGAGGAGDDDNYTYCTIGSDALTEVDAHNSIREVFMRVANHPAVWSCVAAHLNSHNRQKVMFAARLLHVLMCYKEVRLLTKLHEVYKMHSIVDRLVAAVARTENAKSEVIAAGGAPAAADLVVTEMLLLALGSLMGSSAVFPWEVDGLTLAPLHAAPSAFTPIALNNNAAIPTPGRTAAFLSPGKAPLPVSPHANVNLLNMLAIDREERTLLQAQKRADLEYGSTASELLGDNVSSPHAALSPQNAAPLLALERELRLECVEKLSPYLQSIIENDDPSNIGATTAALRVLQITLRDCDSVNGVDASPVSMRRLQEAKAQARQIAAQIHYYCFVTLLPEMNKVQVIIALDVLGLMTLNADFSIDEAVQIVTDLLQTQDPVVRCKAIDTLVCCSLNPTCLASIHAFSLGPLAHLLRYIQHLHDATLDSLCIIASVLFILTRLVRDEGACDVILKSAVFNAMLEVLKLDDGVLHGQALLDTHARTLVPAAQAVLTQESGEAAIKSGAAPSIITQSHMVTMQTIRHLIFECIHAFTSHHACRSILLAANIPHFLLQQLALYGAASRLSPNQDLSLLAKGRIAEIPDAETQAVLHSLFLLAFKAHRSLKDALTVVPDACHSLVRIWAGPSAQLSYKALVVLMRCGVSGDPTKASTEYALKGDGTTAEATLLERAYKQLTAPWTILVDTSQVFLLCDLIDESSGQGGAKSGNNSAASTTSLNNEAALVTFDEYTDTQVKIIAVEALHLIVRRANADHLKYAAVQEVVQDLCKAEHFMPRLESMCRLTAAARALINDLRALSNINFNGNPEELCTIVAKQMRLRSIIQKSQGMTMLAEYCRKNKNDLSGIRSLLPVELVCSALPEVTRHCLIKSLQRARSAFLTDLPEVVELMLAVVTIRNAFSSDKEINARMRKLDGANSNTTTSDDASLTSADNRDDLGVQKTLGYGPDAADYTLKSIFDALTVLSGYENSAAVLVGSKTLAETLLCTLALQVESVHQKRADLERRQQPRGRAGNSSREETGTPNLCLEDHEVEACECELVIITGILDVLLHLAESSSTAESAINEQLLRPCSAATGEDETGLDMLLTLAVDGACAPILSYRPDSPRNIKFVVKNFVMRPIEPSLGELLFFILYHLSCGAALSTAVTYIAHGSFMTDLNRHLREDIDNWLSLVPHLQAEAKDASQVLQCLSTDSDGTSATNSPTRTSDKPTQSMEAYVADILSAKLAMLTNLSRVATGRDRIFSFQTELQSLLQIIILYVELPDVKLIYASLTLLLSLAPMVHQPPVKEKVISAFVSNAMTACFNAAARAEDLGVIDKVSVACTSVQFS